MKEQLEQVLRNMRRGLMTTAQGIFALHQMGIETDDPWKTIEELLEQ